ncbi:tetratricopeptide repeat protein [Candidatus Pelagibacter communis]|uniref:tetratricopeptide repeat protein n=1 Tax=Pelagibacter ubique TaxID=198252 RepID=UPI00094CAE8C|nr:tetratricopeptide repeat protein [Candidatus Pelagibacter ubique]
MTFNLKKVVLLIKGNNFTEAMKKFKETTIENKNDFNFYFYRGITNFKLNKFNDAKKDFEKSILLNSSSPEVFF